MIEVRPTVAIRRLEWVLEGLDSKPGWGADAAVVMAPAFADVVPPEMFVNAYQRRAERFAPVTVVALEADGDYSARASVADVEGAISVVHCHVEEAEPHRITRTWMLGYVPDGLTDRLPVVFGVDDVPSARAVDGGSRLVVMTGVPGSGKSTIADEVGRVLGDPVFAMDWLLGALTPFGGHHLKHTGEIADELLTTLAFRQLVAGQSSILDAPAEDAATRERWISMAKAAGARLRVVHCVCTDLELHRSRVEGRRRGIPGWYDAGDWGDVTTRMAAFTPWPAATLTLDTSRPLADCVADAVAFITRGT
ncbi:hypothetical protein SAMN06264364_10965 [Quadrisphaera granulorum]|uniref:AAA domain-containing protein n=1 Tax=Quadrisphaera granulorum TaxID=317664 RepID=A0A316A8M0_9ACTN|nr:ATP-binding protein [Quadrisphaera granulorum]PWJ53983.1 hypothetical protein BXY45_10965 [Quadrisphaera granulorum]SZE96440.1 hypothetical protein SAMN06264364_10965 [Quadrisphaera granulorum]